MRILILINDDKELCLTMRHALASQGFAVDVADAGVKVFDQVREVSYDLVLLEYGALKASGQTIDGLHSLRYNGAIFIVSNSGDEESNSGRFIMAWTITS